MQVDINAQDKKLNILVFTQYFYPENLRINSLCEELVKKGHRVKVVTGYPQYPKGEIYEGYGFDVPYEKEYCGVEIERVKMSPRGKNKLGLLKNCISYVHYANKWVKKCKERFDAVFVYCLSPVSVALPAIKYKKKFKTPIFLYVQDLWPESVDVVLGIHNKFVLKFLDDMVRKIYFNSDKILCTSKGFVENIKNKGFEDEKLVYWPQFYQSIDTASLKKEGLFEEGKVSIVYAGNVGEAQGLDTIIETANASRDSDYRFYIVGSGRYEETLKAKAKELGLNNVCFKGRVSEGRANEYIANADMAYLSLKENKVLNLTVPAKFQTYLACKTPILAVISGEAKQLILEYKTGEVAERNPESVLQAISRITKNDRSFYSENCEKCFNENFDMEKLLNELISLISLEIGDK